MNTRNVLWSSEQEKHTLWGIWEPATAAGMKDGLIKDLYAPEDFWLKTLDLYTGETEVSPVVVVNEDDYVDKNAYNEAGSSIERVIDNSMPHHFWSVYLLTKGSEDEQGGLPVCIGDFTFHKDAVDFAVAAAAVVKRGSVLRVGAIAVEPQIDRNKPSDAFGAYLPDEDRETRFETAADNETPDICAVLIQDTTNMLCEWELLEDFATEQEARDYAALVIQRGWC